MSRLPELCGQLELATLQATLDASRNAVAKGVAQYHTPPELGRRLASALPRMREVVVDLTCGRGDLLMAAANHTTRHLLGVEITHTRWGPPPECRLPELAADQAGHSVIHADVAAVIPLLRQVDARADVWVLNPPWGLQWPREAWVWMDESNVPAVQEVMRRHPQGTMDSVLVTLMAALDRSGRFGEGFVIGNASTLARLLFAPGAPYAPLAAHVWAAFGAGLPMHTRDSVLERMLADFHGAGVLYFAKDNTDGLAAWNAEGGGGPGFPEFRGYTNRYRGGYGGSDSELATEIWPAVQAEVAARAAARRTDWNLWLDAEGRIATQLSVFDQHDVRLDEDQVRALHSMRGKRPLQLVLQRGTRLALKQAAAGTVWRVSPQLQAAVTEAIRAYDEVRAPLVPLTPLMRIGYLDEEDAIQCGVDLTVTTLAGEEARFRRGERYRIETGTVRFEQAGSQLNAEGERDDVINSGQELAIWITDDAGVRTCFMDGTLRAKGFTVLNGAGVDATLHQLADHFIIPDVADLGTLHPERLAENGERLRRLEQCIVG